MQEYNTTSPKVAPSNNPFAVMQGDEPTIWDLEYSDIASDPSEYADDGYTSAGSILRESRMSSARRKSAIHRAKLRTRKARQQHRPRNSEEIHRPRLDESQNKASPTSPVTPVSTPLETCLAAHDADFPALDYVWKLLEIWYTHRGREKRPACAVEQSCLDQLHFIGTRENACTYLDRQGNVLHVTSSPLRGWEGRGLHIIIAFSSDRDPVIIRGRGSAKKEKSKDEGTTTFPFYIWQGISGDEEGWESEPSISKVVRYSNPSFYEPTNLKRRRLETPTSSRSLDPTVEGPRAPKSIKKSQSLLSESFPELFARLSEWIKNDNSHKDPAFVLNKQPDLYLSKRHPGQRIRYVDLDGGPVKVDLYSTGAGKKHVIVAQGPSLEPALISFDHFPKLPKYYTAYYRWTSTKTWFEPPCVFKVFGGGPYEPPRKFVGGVVLGVGWLAQIKPLAPGVSSSKASNSTCRLIDSLKALAIPDQTTSASEVQTNLATPLPTPAANQLLTNFEDELKGQKSTFSVLAQPDPGFQSRNDIEMGCQSEHTLPISDQSKTGTEEQPIQIPDNPSPIKKEVPDDAHAQVPMDPRARSSTNPLAINETKSSNRPSRPERIRASVADSVSFRFISGSASQPRERSFAQCNNVKLLFSNAKQGGLLKGESSMAPILALQVPGMSEPIGICIGDSKDFDAFVHVLEDILASSHENQGKFIVDVRADHFD